ncbi:E3 ubiquitin-protein ligase bre1 [Allomyces javanicus]|nr:E3 ubiquitin-protein ligase bre1 [Allomyces javanicus]
MNDRKRKPTTGAHDGPTMTVSSSGSGTGDGLSSPASDGASSDAGSDRRKRPATLAAVTASQLPAHDSAELGLDPLADMMAPPLFPADSPESLKLLIRTFQKDAVYRHLRDLHRTVERLQGERDDLATKNSQLVDALAAIGGWWSEIVDELLVLWARFDLSTNLHELMSKSDTARSSFLSALLETDKEDVLEDELNATHTQARQIVASFIHYVEHRADGPATSTVLDQLQARYTAVQRQLVRVERQLAGAQKHAADHAAQLAAKDDEIATLQRAVDRLQSRTWQTTFQQPLGPRNSAAGPAASIASSLAATPAASSANLPDLAGAPDPASPARMLTLADVAAIPDDDRVKELAALTEQLAQVRQERDALAAKLQTAPDESVLQAHPYVQSQHDEAQARAREAALWKKKHAEATAENASLRDLHAALQGQHRDAVAAVETQAEAEAKRLSEEITRLRRQRDDLHLARDSLTAEKNAKLHSSDAAKHQVAVKQARIESLAAQSRRLQASLVEQAGLPRVAKELLVDPELLENLEARLAASAAAAADSVGAESDVTKLQAQLALAQRQVTMLTRELNSVVEGYERLDATVATHVRALAERDDHLARLIADKTKLDGKILFLRKQLEQLKAEADGERRAVDAARDAQRAADDAARAAQAHIVALTKELAAANDVAAAHRTRALDLDAQMTHYVRQAKDADARAAVAAATRDARIADAEQARHERSRAQDALKQAEALLAERDARIAKLEADAAKRRDDPPSSEAEVMLEQYRQLLLCGTCKTRFKDTAIARCMHTFCRQCVQDRLDTRQRKCPTCSEPFGSNDVRTIYM